MELTLREKVDTSSFLYAGAVTGSFHCYSNSSSIQINYKFKDLATINVDEISSAHGSKFKDDCLVEYYAM
jgi:hypothetical protein